MWVYKFLVRLTEVYSYIVQYLYIAHHIGNKLSSLFSTYASLSGG